MDITTVRDNLKNTIYGKKILLDTCASPSDDKMVKIVNDVISNLLAMNIRELEEILTDVEQICEEQT